MFKKKIIIIIITISITAIIFALLAFFLPRILLYSNIKNKLSNFPMASAAPVNREIKKINSGFENLTTARLPDFEMQFPYEILSQAIESDFLAIEFSQNRRMNIVKVPSEQGLISGLINKQKNSRRTGRIDKILGKNAMGSNFQLAKIALKSTPEKISFFSNTNELVAASILLPIKWILTTPPVTGNNIHEFKINGLDGFQIGAPENNRTSVNFLIYNTMGDQYQINLSGSRISQDNIDFILSSIKLNTSSPISL